jgi:hypothetical protein
MNQPTGLVDAWGMEWEADRRSRVANHVLFWAWYLPADIVRTRSRVGRRPAFGRSRALVSGLRLPASLNRQGQPIETETFRNMPM